MVNFIKNINNDKKTKIFVLFFAMVYLFINLYLIFYKETAIFSLFPLFLAVLCLYFVSIDKVFLLTALLCPLSINLSDFDINLSLNLPTEPMLAGLLLFWIFYSLYNFKSIPSLEKHPMSIAFYFYFIWLIISCLFSKLPMVSWKFFISHLWLIVPTYFLGTRIFLEKEDLQKKFILLQIYTLAIVIVYTLVRHAGYSFADKPGHWVMQPFFKDHTIYGATLSLFIPILFIFSIDKSKTLFQRFFMSSLLFIFLLGIFFSYCRAAWLGVIAAMCCGAVVWFRIKFKYIFICFITFLAIIFVFHNQILQRLQQNKQDSSVDVAKNFESISNISTDDSNLERINRWSCALRMSEDNPIVGTGPGTYQFLYGPYQLSSEITQISTNAGTLGNAHSEYLGPLAETGWPGLLSILVIVFSIFFTGFTTYAKISNRNSSEAKILLGVLLGLVAYFVHGIMNNYLDTDKLAIPIWGFVAIIVAINIKMKKESI